MTAGPADTLTTPGPPSAEPRSSTRPTGLRRDIEGLRAFAVLAVLAYHVGAPLTGGFSGVDVFFVISGFLITSHLLKELDATGRVRLLRFYGRRAKRLLPAATLVLLCTLVAGFFLLSTTALRTLVDDVVAATVYLVNWALAGRSVDYLAEDVAPSAVQHYWSLSIEEQFYVVVPILLLLVGLLVRRSRRSPRAVATVVIALLVAASFAASVLLTAGDPAQAYFVTWTRVWELGVGSLLACGLTLLTRIPGALAQVLAVVGSAAMVAGVVLVDATTPWPGSAALLPVLGTAAVIAAGCATPRTVVGRVLSVSPLVWIGGLSYSIYLWHWPLVVFADVVAPDQPNVRLAGVLVLTFVLSYLGKRFVEDPIRFGRITATSGRALLVGGVAMAIVIASALGVRATLPTLDEQRPAEAQGAQVSGAPRVEEAELTVEDVMSALGEDDAADADPTRAPDGWAGPALQVRGSAQVEPATDGDVYPEPGAATDDVGANYENGCHAEAEVTEPNLECVFGDPNGDYMVVVAGDSKMGQWFEPLVQIAEQQGWRLEFYVKSACGFGSGTFGGQEACEQYNSRLLDLVLAEPGRVDAVVTSAGDRGQGARDWSGEVFAGTWQTLVDAGIDVYPIADNPPPGGGADTAVYECVEENRQEFSACTFPETISIGTAEMLSAAHQVPEVRVVDLADVICPTDGDCPAVVGGVLAYRQGSHLTTTYVETLEPYLREGLRAAGMPIE